MRSMCLQTSWSFAETSDMLLTYPLSATNTSKVIGHIKNTPNTRNTDIVRTQAFIYGITREMHSDNKSVSTNFLAMMPSTATH